MAEFKHTVNVGVDVAVQNAERLTALEKQLRSLQSLSKTQTKPQSQSAQIANDAKLLRAQTQQEAALTEAINQQAAARNKSTIQSQQFIAAQNRVSAALVKTEAEFFKAASAADRLAESQRELNRIAAIKSQASATKADAGLVTAQAAQAKAIAAAQAQQATAQNNLSAATESAQARAVKAANSNAAAQAAAARSSTQFAAAQLRTDAELLRATTAYEKASLAANTFAQAQARAGQRKGIVELLSSPQIREAGESIGQAGFAFNQFVTGPLVALARVSTESAFAIDENVNSIKALTGSASAAEGRFQALFTLAQKTPGLTTDIATALDSQLKLANVSEGIVDRFLVTVGRLNSIKSIGDPQEFANNLRQLVDQGFEKADLKQVVNRNPIAGELIKQVFGVDNPTNSEAIRSSAARLGVTTAERFFDELAKAGENNPKLKNATESLSVQLEKSQDRLQVAVRPLGLVLINAIIPAIQAAVPVVETLAAGFDKLPAPIKALTISLALLAAGVGPALGLFGGFVQTFQVFQVTKILQLASATTATGTAAAGAATGMGLFAGSLAAVRTALAATATFLFTTPAGWAVLAAAALAAGVAYLAFNDSQKKVIEQADNLKLGDLTGQLTQVKNLQSQLAEAENLTGAQSNLNAEQERFNRILGTLTPQQQAVIGALGSQKAKVDELKQSLKEALAAKQAEAQAEQIILLAAVAARQREIDATNEAIKRLQEQLRLRNELLKSGQTTQTETIGAGFGEALTLTEDIAAKERDLANERLKSGKQLDELNKAQQENITKLRATLPLLGLTEEQLLKEAQAGRLTTEQFGLLKKALDSAGAASIGTAAGADNVSAALSAMQKRAQDAQRALETLFSTGDATELRKQVTDRVNQITGQALKAGSGVSGALGEFNKALKDSNDPLASQVKNLQDFEKIQTALNEKVAPKKATGGGGRSTVARDALADIKSRDDLIRAQFEREIGLQQNTNQRLQAANQSAFDRQLKGVREFLERKRQLEEASAELDLRAARTAAERANGELLRIQQAQSQTKNKADQQRLAGEEDRVRAEIVRAEEAITLAQRRRADVGIQASRDLQKALEDEAEKLREIEVRFLEITDKQSAAARLTVGAESDRQLKSLNLEFAAVTTAVEKAQADGRTADAEALASQQERLRVAIQQTEEIRRQSLLNVDFAQAQRDLTEIDRARSLALDEQQRKLEAVGATDDEVTKQRREVMRLYQQQIDAVIERLQILQNQGARNPEIEKTIQDLQNRKKNETALSLGQQLSPGIGNVDQIFAERQRQIDAINRSGTLTSLEKDQARKAVIEATNRQLERQLELLRLIFAEKGLPLNEQFKELENRVKDSNNQTQSFGTTLRDVAQQGAINSLTGFFTDIASGAKSFKDAALDALGSFIQALQQAVIQAIVLNLVLALFGGGAGAAVPAGASKGGAVAGLAEGGAVRPRRYASGGQVQYDPTGLLRGPGGGRADKILAYFPAANRVARVSNTEYVLDAETTRNLTVPFLDRIRAAKGRVKFGGGFAEGGAVSAAGNSILNVSPNVAGGDTNVALNQTIQLSPVEMTRRALRDRSVVRDILEVIGNERTRVNATLSS